MTAESNADLERLVKGAAAAALAGLLAGGMLHPNLRPTRAAEGPQLLAGVSGARIDRSGATGASWASYSGEIPPYVLGTDWIRSPPSKAVADDEPAEADPLAEPDAEVAEVETFVGDDPSPEPTVYPSMSGGQAYGIELPPPQPPIETG